MRFLGHAGASCSPPPRSNPAVALVAVACVAACGGGAPAPYGGSPEAGPSEPVREPVPCILTRIVDGDTVHCDGRGSVRLIGMDTPERGQEPFGRMATAELSRLAPVGTRLLLERDVEERDDYGRLLGYLWLSRGDSLVLLNWEMVRRGYAVVLTYPPNVQYVETLVDAQERARHDAVGLWGVNGFACPPVDYRAGRCGR